MKKIFVLFITLLLCLSLSSCKDKTCEKDPSQEKCQPVEKTCDEDPSQEKCQPVEKTCDTDPTQEKCNIFRKTCKEDPTEERCNDSAYGDIAYMILKTSESEDVVLLTEDLEEITTFFNKFKFLEIDFVGREELKTTAVTTSEYLELEIRYETKPSFDSIKYEYSQKYKITKDGKVENTIRDYCYYTDAGVIDYQELYDYLDQNGEKRMPIPEFNMEDLDIVLTKLNPTDIESVSSTCITNFWQSDNKSLIKYITDEIKQVNFVEKLTEENKEDILFVPVIRFLYADDVLIQLYLIEPDYLYIVYSNIVDSYYSPAIRYQFRSEQKVISQKLKIFADAKLWSVKYCKDESVTSYIDESLVDKARQESIIYWYVSELADLARYYEDGVQYSGYIKKYYGEYGVVPKTNPESLSVLMVQLNEEVYEPIERIDVIDGVEFKYKDTNQIYCNNGGSFYTLQEAFDYGYITHADLVTISEIHNN